MKKKHAWYSAKMAKIAPSIFYRHEDGHEVLITWISEVEGGKPEDPPWEDAVYMGVVTDYLRTDQDPREEFHRF